MTESTSADYHASCYDCERTFSRSLPQRAVCMDLPSGGYDFVQVPLCQQCIHERFGYECGQCGLRHDDQRSAEYCCQRDPADAPDCLECDRRMAATVKGHDPVDGAHVTVAECECCPVGWGAFTGWFHTDDGPCPHVDGDDLEDGGVALPGGDAER
jgi:hypothetical protein